MPKVKPLGESAKLKARWDAANENFDRQIGRLRNELQGSSGWEIESERGKSYVLKRRHNS